MVECLRCPDDQGKLRLCRTTDDIAPALECDTCGNRYPVVNRIPRFVVSENYANTFGFQWNQFRKTQLDSFSGITLSKDRFYQQCKLKPEDLKGKTVLDTGCGAGRFTEIALQAGATVYAVDFSSAVDACRENHASSETLHVVQADIYRLPFSENQFDYIYCFGVLQHTPNVREAFLKLPRYLKPGGGICVDIYLKRWHRKFHPKRLLRPLTKRIEKKKLFCLIQWAAPVLLGLNRGLRLIPVVGRFAIRMVPIADYTGMYGLDRQKIREWSILDTFDWLSPEYDSPQAAATLQEWMEYAKLENIEVEVHGFVVGRATKADLTSGTG